MAHVVVHACNDGSDLPRTLAFRDSFEPYLVVMTNPVSSDRRHLEAVVVDAIGLKRIIWFRYFLRFCFQRCFRGSWCLRLVGSVSVYKNAQSHWRNELKSRVGNFVHRFRFKDHHVIL